MKRIFTVLQSTVTNKFTGTVTAKFSKFKNKGDSGNTQVSVEPDGANHEPTDRITGYAQITCTKLPDENGVGGEFTATLSDGNTTAEMQFVTTSPTAANVTVTGEATFEAEVRQDTTGQFTNTNYEEWNNAAEATEPGEKEVRNIDVTNTSSGNKHEGRDFIEVKKGANDLTFIAKERATGCEFTVVFESTNDEQPQFTAVGVGVTEGAEV